MLLLVTKTAVFCDQKQHLITYDLAKNAKGEISYFTIPHWEQCVKTVLKAQTLFAPLRTIGWDVGITNHGPVLIEGNVFAMYTMNRLADYIKWIL